MENGLVHMAMHPPTDRELQELPHVILTSNEEWKPSLLDHAHNQETWFDTMDQLPDLDCDHPFDEHSTHLSTNEIAVNLA